MSREKQIKSTDWLTARYSEEEIEKMKAEAIKEAENELREKQIEEMAKVLVDYTTKNKIMASKVFLEEYAEELYNAGHRKQSEVAREIFEEILRIGGVSNGVFLYNSEIDELKKKYTEGKE